MPPAFSIGSSLMSSNFSLDATNIYPYEASFGFPMPGEDEEAEFAVPEDDESDYGAEDEPILPAPRFADLEAQLNAIVSQAEFYFSDANLHKDTFLRQQLDADSWIPVATVAAFKRMTALTSDLNLVICAVKQSKKLEVAARHASLLCAASTAAAAADVKR